MKKILKPLASLVAATTLAGTAWAANWGYHDTDRSWTVIKIGDVSTGYSLDGSGSPAFQNADLGTIVQGDALTIVKYDTKTWKNGGDVTGCEYTYAIDGGTPVSMGGGWLQDLGWDGSSQNQLWGNASVNAAIDTTGMTPGRHTLTISGAITGGTDPAGPISDGPYTAGFVVSAGGGGGTVVTTNTVKYTVATKDSVTVTGTAPTGSSPTYEQSYNTAGQATSNKYLRLTLSGYAGKTITGLTLSMKSNAKAGRGSLDVTCGDATIAAIANSTFSNGWYTTYSSSYVDIKPTVTPTVIDNNDVVIEINCTYNSLYCQSYEVTYTEGQTAPTDFSVALALSADEVELGTAATATATPQNAAEGRVTYEWTIDNEPAGGSGYVLSLATGVAGDHTVKCIATDANGAKATNTVTYTVYAMYNVTVDPNIQHGTVTVDPARAKAGATVTVTASGVGYEVETLTYSYNGGEPIDIVNNTFTMPAADVTVTATFVEVIDYTHLPFEHDTTWLNANVTGMTVYNCGSDYSSGDGAKLNNAGSYVQIKFAEAPSQLIYKIMQNGSSTADYEFVVQESETGASWTPLATFTPNGTALPTGTQTGYTNALSASTRVVRFLYATKAQNLNVGLYYVAIENEVPATKYNVTVDENIEHGTVTVDKTEAAEGATVNVTASPDRGYALATLQYNGTDIVNGSFTMPAADVEVTATFTAVPVYKRIESADDFVTGAKYLVVAYKEGNSGYTSALKNVATANDQISVDETLSIEFADDGKFISVDNASIVWKVLVGNEAGVDYVLFNDALDVYAAALNDGNKAQLLSDGTDALAQWSLVFTGLPAVKMYSRSYPGRWLQRNGSINNKFFATYDTTGTEPWLFIDTSVESQRVTFDHNDGEETVTTMRYVKGEQYPWFERLHRTGYVHIGWYDQREGGNRILRGAVTEADERTVYAHWSNTQTVKFVPNGGTCDPLSRGYTIGGTYTSLPTPVLAGQEFQGWYTIDGDAVTASDDVTYETSRTLYARWVGQETQTVTCNPNGGRWNGGTAEPMTVVCGIGGYYPTFLTPIWTDHVFLGWFTAAEGGTRVMSGTAVSDESTLSLYAHWTTTQTVKFDANGGTCDTQSIPCQLGGFYPALPVPTWSGHSFSGWFTDGGTRVSQGDAVTLEKSRTLYAQWEEQNIQTVTFNPNGGTCAKSTMTATIGSTYPIFPTPRRAGYTFRGWFTAAGDDGTRVYSGAKGMTVSEDATRTLYAHWTSGGPVIAGISTRAAGPTARGVRSNNFECTLQVETVADVVYEIQWTDSLGGEWTVLKHWVADADGEIPVTVSVPAASQTGFFRLAILDGE